MATSTLSASKVRSLPSLPFARTVARPSAMSTPSTLVERWKVNPSAASAFWSPCASSASKPAPMRGRNSTTSTFAPSRFQTDPSSSPMAPPPMTTIRSGTRSNASASVEVTVTLPSIGMFGSEIGSEPVARRTFLVTSSSAAPPPSALVTTTLPGAVTCPVPW